MVSSSLWIKSFIPVIIFVNILTFLIVWQIYENVMLMDEKLQKLVIEKEISQVSIETDFSKKESDLLKGLGKQGQSQHGRLQLVANNGGPQRVPIAKLQEANSWMGHARGRRELDDQQQGLQVGDTAENAFRVEKVPGSNDFRVVKIIDSNSDANVSKPVLPPLINLTDGGETYLPKLDGENIIAMSLWGHDRRYTVGALRNAELVQRYFPGWKMRIYTETKHEGQMYESIPKDIVDSLRNLRVQFEFMDPKESNVPPMMWRFLVGDDMSVDRFIVRDADSRLSARDAATVYAWEQSGKPFHCVRDHPSHAAYPLSGGMWGGKPEALRKVLRKSWRELMYGYRQDYLQDMHFLQQVIWPKVRAYAYCSDSVSCDKWPSSHPFPIKRYSYEHVGQVYGANELSRPEDIRILRQSHNPRCVPP